MLEALPIWEPSLDDALLSRQPVTINRTVDEIKAVQRSGERGEEQLSCSVRSASGCYAGSDVAP